MDKSSLGYRMKAYESVPKNKLLRKTPVIMRLDGKAFHTFTRGLEKPYSVLLRNAMMATAEHLVNNIQGALFAYVQSDEISILISDWERITTDAWFEYNVQKMASISASMATGVFNNTFEHPTKSDFAMFDSRVYNTPAHEVVNYFVWRQQDATRNSIQMLGQHNFSHRQLQGKSCSKIQDMLMELEPPINWNDQPTWAKRGSSIVTNKEEKDSGKLRRVVSSDMQTPIFTQDREYIDKYLEGIYGV